MVGNIVELGNFDTREALPLDYLDHEFWHGTIEVEPSRVTKIHYSYVYKNDQDELIQEGGHDRIV